MTDEITKKVIEYILKTVRDKEEEEEEEENKKVSKDSGSKNFENYREHPVSFLKASQKKDTESSSQESEISDSLSML